MYYFLAATFLGVIPFLYVFGRSDSYLSFDLYSGKVKRVYVAIDEKYHERLTSTFNVPCVQHEDIVGGKIVDLQLWAVHEFNAPMYPAKWTYMKVLETF